MTLEPVRIIVRVSVRPKLDQSFKWRVWLENGTVLLERSKRPFVEGARAMLALGYDPEVLITMRHEGSAIDSFEPARLGSVAAVTVTETDFVAPRFEKWRPFPEIDRSDTRKRSRTAAKASEVADNPEGAAGVKTVPGGVSASLSGDSAE